MDGTTRPDTTTNTETTMASLPPHGTDNRYCNGPCRCNDCRAAHAAVHRRRRRLVAYGRLLPGYVPGHGTRRRIRALTAIGWPYQELAVRLGVTWSGASQLARRPESTPVTPRIRDAIAALYEELSMVPGPSLRARTWAAKRNWAPPLAWDDDTIDDPEARPSTAPPAPEDARHDELAVRLACSGHIPYRRLRPVERGAAVRRLHAQGLTDHEIAAALHAEFLTVQKRRERLDLAPNPERDLYFTRSA